MEVSHPIGEIRFSFPLREGEVAEASVFCREPLEVPVKSFCHSTSPPVLPVTTSGEMSESKEETSGVPAAPPLLGKFGSDSGVCLLLSRCLKHLLANRSMRIVFRFDWRSRVVSEYRPRALSA